MSYRDDLEGALRRAEAQGRELADARRQGLVDQSRIAQLQGELVATRHAIALLRRGEPFAYAPHLPYQGSSAATVLVLGILSLVVCGLLGPVAWQLGNQESRRIEDRLVDPATRGTVTAGRVLGIVATVLMLLSLFILVPLLAVG